MNQLFRDRQKINSRTDHVNFYYVNLFNSPNQSLGFHGGPVVKNQPSNPGNIGLIPGQGTKVPYA